jgi:hypothetical protein
MGKEIVGSQGIRPGQSGRFGRVGEGIKPVGI